MNVMCKCTEKCDFYHFTHIALLITEVINKIMLHESGLYAETSSCAFLICDIEAI